MNNGLASARPFCFGPYATFQIALLVCYLERIEGFVVNTLKKYCGASNTVQMRRFKAVHRSLIASRKTDNEAC